VKKLDSITAEVYESDKTFEIRLPSLSKLARHFVDYIKPRYVQMGIPFINKLYGQASIIITSNKSPEDWGELLGDPAITTAILDCIVHKCEVLNLDGDSYRLKHRKNVFVKN